jgi:threonine dehydrogenase-like Zn-dependent dehydrogenase
MSGTMWRAQLDEGADEFRLEEAAVPKPAPDECVVKVHACGICGSDLHILESCTNSAMTLRQSWKASGS